MKSLLAATALSILTYSALAQGATLKWASEDGNNDGVWNYSSTNWNFVSGNQWGNIVLTPLAFEGRSALAFKYLNQDLNDGGSHTQAFGFALIPTSNANNGTEPGSVQESDAGKDLRGYENLEFQIRGEDGANRSNFTVWLRSPNGHGSVQVPLRNYVSVNNNWQKVVIPVKAFLPADGNPNNFQLWNVHAVGFYVNQDNSNVPFEFLVDDIRFVSGKGNSSMPDTRYWWKDDANHNGEYNYSTTAMSNGSSIQTANQWGDLPTGTHYTGPFGDTPVPKVDLVFHHNGTGYAEANFTTKPDNSGFEPTSFAERDAGKVIERHSAKLTFAAPEVGDGVRVKLVDAYGRSSKSVDVKDYRSTYGRYAFSYAIPTSVFAGNGFDYNNVKSVTFFVDGNTPGGDYHMSLLHVTFQRDQ